MYCIECGEQIPENSKFCSHCGKSQTEAEPSIKEKVAEKIIEHEIVRQVVNEHKNSLDYQFLKKSMGYYLAWILFHLTLLLVFSRAVFLEHNYGLESFWPFGGFWGGYMGDDFALYYDITEFMVYTFFPLIILVIISLTREQNKKDKKFGLSFEDWKKENPDKSINDYYATYRYE